MRELGISEAEARGAAGAFFLTGTETVATLVPRLIALLHDAGQFDRVAADPALLDPAIDEAMRVSTPTPMMLRSVHAETAIGDVPVRPGTGCCSRRTTAARRTDRSTWTVRTHRNCGGCGSARARTSASATRWPWPRSARSPRPSCPPHPAHRAPQRSPRRPDPDLPRTGGDPMSPSVSPKMQVAQAPEVGG
ncbi:hypothetical protein ACFQZ4_51560 [Catellatospora coxensis]